jgi:hypothetical protein
MSDADRHTPGPWVIRDHTVGHPPRRAWIEINAPLGSGRGEHPICRIPAGFTNQDADARLIAAAPELVEAAQELVTNLANMGRDGDYLSHQVRHAAKQLRAALARVDGGGDARTHP